MLHAAIGSLMLVGLANAAPDASRCSLRLPDGGRWVPTVEATRELVGEAEIIVRARAFAVDSTDVGGAFAALVRFEVLDRIKGEAADTIGIMGHLVDEPDFNPDTVPYLTVRAQGLSGSCFARTYQRGGEFLLMLKTIRGQPTPYWAALQPVNEQVRGAEDPWVAWVREQLAGAMPADALFATAVTTTLGGAPAAGTLQIARPGIQLDRPAAHLMAPGPRVSSPRALE